MGILSGVVQQLKTERESAQEQIRRIDAALAALGGVSSNGASRTMSAAARRRISLAQKARWAKHENSQAEADDLSSWSQKDRSGSESTVGESEEGSLRQSANRCLSHQRSMRYCTHARRSNSIASISGLNHASSA
jgi:hypothetical protein